MPFQKPDRSNSDPIFKNRFLTLSRVTADFGDHKKEYFVTDTGRRAGVVADQDGKILLVRQYRLLIDGLSWEIPGGRVDEGEDIADAAAREFLEETGYRCRGLKELIHFEPGLDTRINPSHIFLTREVEQTGALDHEAVLAEWVSLGQCIRMIKDGDIMDGFTITAFLAYKVMHER